ncbi:MAG: SCP2 sterol-binding domain-containing protein, partial [Dehalococcoidia bacterium]
DLVVEGDNARLESTVKGPADLNLIADTSTFILMVYDRVSLESSISHGGVAVEGDLELVGNFDRWLAAH